MPVTHSVWEFPEPPPLHTEESFRAIGRPAYEQGGLEAHWYDWWIMLGLALRAFGFPAALYERCGFARKTREEAFALVRMLEAALRRILLIMAGEDTRPLEPCMPAPVRTSKKSETQTGAAHQPWRGFAPEKLPIRFALVPAVSAPAKPDAPRRPAPRLALPPELTLPPIDRQDRMARPVMIAEFRRQARENTRVPVFSLVARLEAMIRIYKDPRAIVMRLRQRIAAEQGRRARLICTRMLAEPVRITRVKGGVLESLYDGARAAAKDFISGRPPPFVRA